ncbi:ABC transporter substrate-binding protein [Sporosarcina sp. OR05]|uniref:ABC transporter substrate-binding protein n=1 Tax=Sporosarcina sp. OR05 TaxID=2969819 RepID=UPI00352A2F71
MRFNQTFVFIILSALLILTACGSKDVGNNDSSKTNKQQTSAPGERQVLRISMATEVDNLDPYQSAATDTGSMMDNVFDGLFDTNEAGELEPRLATDVVVSEDGLTYTFTLREGVTFHNGATFTAKDVVYSYDRLAGLTSGEPLSSKFSVISSIEAKSDTEVAVVLKEVDSSFLARNIVAILPEGYEEHSTKPVGAGPFSFKQYDAGQQLVLEKNENYYLTDRVPIVDEVQFKIMPDSEAALLALQAGDIDVIPGISELGIQQLGDAIDVVSGPQNMVQLMAMNNSFEPFTNVKVRQAINHAINKDVIIQTVAEGKGTKLGSNFSPAMDFFFQEGLENYYPHDIKQAKKLLEEAGYPEGFSFTLTVPSEYQFHVDTAQILASQLAEVGISVSIESIEFSTWLERVYSNAQYEATVISFTGKLDPFEVVGRFVSDYTKNFVKFNDPTFDQAIQSALATTNEDERAEFYKKAQMILTEQAASVFIMDPDRSIGMRKGISGFKMYPIQKFNLEDVTISDKK